MNQHHSLRSPILARGLFRTVCALTVGLFALLGSAAAAAPPHDRGHGRPHRPPHYDDGRSGHHYDDDHDSGRRWRRDYGDHHYRWRGHENRGHHYRGGGSHFDVPHRLNRHQYSTYARYYRGRSYYRDHGHYHRVYYFPVWTDGYYDHRPYAYCEGAIFQPRGPRLGLNFHFNF